jgi:hypothetical protein
MKLSSFKKCVKHAVELTWGRCAIVTTWRDNKFVYSTKNFVAIRLEVRRRLCIKKRCIKDVQYEKRCTKQLFSDDRSTVHVTRYIKIVRKKKHAFSINWHCTVGYRSKNGRDLDQPVTSRKWEHNGLIDQCFGSVESVNLNLEDDKLTELTLGKIIINTSIWTNFLLFLKNQFISSCFYITVP